MMNAKTKNAILLIARLLMSGIFLWSAWGKLGNVSATADLVGVQDWQIIAAGVIEGLGGLLLFFGGCIHSAALLLSVYLVGITVWIHLPLSADNLENTVHFLKNLAMLSGLLTLMVTGGGKYQVYQCRCDA